MKTIGIVLKLNKHLKFRKVFYYALFMMFWFFCFCNPILLPVMGADLKEAPFISLEAKNQPLISVLNKITLDTGFKFKINDEWSNYPVNASIKDMPLDRGLKLVLRGLNHSIIYEPGENVKIVVYGKMNPSKSDANAMQPFTPRSRDIQQEPAQVSEPPPDETELPENVNDNTGAERADTQEGSSGNNEGSPEETITQPDRHMDEDSIDQGVNPDE